MVRVTNCGVPRRTVSSGNVFNPIVQRFTNNSFSRNQRSNNVSGGASSWPFAKPSSDRRYGRCFRPKFIATLHGTLSLLVFRNYVVHSVRTDVRVHGRAKRSYKVMNECAKDEIKNINERFSTPWTRIQK